MGKRYVGIDLHRRRSVIVTMDGEGEVVATKRIANDPSSWPGPGCAAGPDPEVVLEALLRVVLGLRYWASDTGPPILGLRRAR